MSRVNPPLLAVYNRAEDRYVVATEELCLSTWCSDGRDHLAGQICGRPVDRHLDDIPLCRHHWDAAVRWHHEHYGCTVYDETNARRDRAERYCVEKERDERAAERAKEDARIAVVYFRHRESDDMIKIGTTCRFASRMRQLGNEFGPVALLLTVPGSYDREDELHKQFADLAIGNEWFRPGADLMDWIIHKRRTSPGSQQQGVVSAATVRRLAARLAEAAADPAA